MLISIYNMYMYIYMCIYIYAHIFCVGICCFSFSGFFSDSVCLFSDIDPEYLRKTMRVSWNKVD